MPNPKLETYKNKETGTVYDLTDAAAQVALAGILDGTDIESFDDVENALATKVDKVAGKGLSTNDYDNTAKAIVDTAQDNIKANTQLIKDTVGFSGKNKLAIKLSYIKASYPTLFVGNTLNIYGLSFIFETDSNDNVTKITGGGSNATQVVNLVLIPRTSPDGLVLPTGSYKANGTPTMPSGCFVRYFCTRGGNAVVLGDDTGNGIECNIQSTDVVGCLISVANGASINGLEFNLMLRDADILDDSYEPHFGSTAFPRSEQAVLGAKNLLIGDKAVSKTENGLTFTRNDDGTITINGTATATTFYTIQNSVYADDSYILNGCPFGGATNSYAIRWNTGGTNLYDTGNGVLIPKGTATALSIEIRIENGATLNNLVFKPMLRLATDPDDTYVPYAMTNKELTEKKADNDCTVIQSVDLNDFKSNGKYRMNGSITHTPSPNYGFLIVIAYGSDVRQIVFATNLVDTYTRVFTNNSWSSWYKFTLTEQS